MRTWQRDPAKQREHQRVSQQALRDIRRALGQCHDCGAPSPRFWSCKACRDHRNALRAERKAA